MAFSLPRQVEEHRRRRNDHSRVHLSVPWRHWQLGVSDKTAASWPGRRPDASNTRGRPATSLRPLDPLVSCVVSSATSVLQVSLSDVETPQLIGRAFILRQTVAVRTSLIRRYPRTPPEVPATRNGSPERPSQKTARDPEGHVSLNIIQTAERTGQSAKTSSGPCAPCWLEISPSRWPTLLKWPAAFVQETDPTFNSSMTRVCRRDFTVSLQFAHTKWPCALSLRLWISQHCRHLLFLFTSPDRPLLTDLRLT